MRHRRKEKKIGRSTSHRNAMIRNMVTSFIKVEKIITTNIKAKLLKKIADKMITLGKQGSLHAHRQVAKVLRDRIALKKIFEKFAIRFEHRNGGYTRIIKIGTRHGDNASMSLIEFIDNPKIREKES